ncbi:GNAT family N-acetyltransferase [Streptomyces johnsoniae]|uniref:GNAT family N-acetyltransferase n=1 Tax=Streptomyces johnsoniae TaxID=3075532 RepID=A0ABU2S1E9_9ACTN|nr:GNAT family N-acetyltransferase [Streptomyces sp. DSM 41886]MDT0442823.1 GNAT family N-acetyltransferase [Streptomyces sp. DSM 41886]
MTTTLRPAGPEERLPGGPAGSVLPFDIRVNGRRVGGLRLVVAAEPRGRAGEITDLEVDAPERRRGRATVALLAAEEVLRARGCRRVAAAVPAGATGAAALAAGLGYTELARMMSKRLTGPPPALPRDCAVRPAAGAERARWPGEGPGEEAWLHLLAHRGTDVGALWTSAAAAGAPRGADMRVLAVRVCREHRRRGYGRALLLAAERLCLADGGRVLGARVPADGGAGPRLFGALGYGVDEYRLSKPLC